MRRASSLTSSPSRAITNPTPSIPAMFLAFYPQPVTFDLSSAIRDDVTLFTSRGEGGGAVKRALSLAAQGKLRGRDLVTHRFPLEQIQEGFRVLRAREGDPIKVVFVP